MNENIDYKCDLMRNKVNIFKENEKVLCKHDGLLYEVTGY